MTVDVLGDLNWLAIIVAAVAYFALGGLWFAPPVFGKAWTRAIGWEVKPGESPGAAFYIGPLITSLVATIAVAMLAAGTGSSTLAEGLVLGLVVGLGLSTAILFVTAAFDPTKPHPLTHFVIVSGYHLLGLLIVSVIVSVWR